MWDLIWGIITDYAQWQIDKFIKLLELALDLVQQAITYLVELLPDGYKEAISTIPWETMHDYMDDVNWFIPIYNIIGMVLGTIGIAAAVRMMRWIKSFIPTISG